MTKDQVYIAIESLSKVIGAIEVVGNLIKQKKSVVDFETTQWAEVYLGSENIDGFSYERKIFTMDDFKTKGVISDFEIIKDKKGKDWGRIYFIPKIFFSQAAYKKKKAVHPERESVQQN